MSALRHSIAAATIVALSSISGVALALEACESESLAFCLQSVAPEVTGDECPDDEALAMGPVSKCPEGSVLTCDVLAEDGSSKIADAHIYKGSPLLVGEGCMVIDALFNTDEPESAAPVPD